MKVNLACGNVFLVGDGWHNFDFISSHPAVHSLNLLDALPLNSGSVELLYSSHFLEHIPISQVDSFLQECHGSLS